MATQFDPVDLVEQQDQLAAHEVAFVLWPKAWKRFRLRRRLAWKTQPLQSGKQLTIPRASGIYSLLIQPKVAKHPACSYVMYVGQATNLRKRFNTYCAQEKRIRPKIVRLLYMWDGYLHFCSCRVPRNDLDRVEEALIGSYVPPANSDFPGTLGAAKKAF